nr:yrdC domain-containing protein, mitochondrial [Leptinotarsa decemlineata]
MLLKLKTLLGSTGRLSKMAYFESSPTTAHISITDSTVELTAVNYLKSGSVIAVPTDTVYGLACDATNKSAINQLYKIKCRNENKPLAICLNEVSRIGLWASVHHLPSNLLGALLPGPVTVILQLTNNTLDKSLSLNGKVGIRVPDYDFIRNISCGLGKPLALTSANFSNHPSAVEILQFKSIWDKIPAIFDGGKLNYNNEPSTIIDLSESGVFKIVREGAALEETISMLRKFGLKQML